MSTGVSGGGQRSASIACSSWESMSQALRLSSSVCTSPISAIRASKSASGSAMAMPSSSIRDCSALMSATASSTFSSTVLPSVNGGSCSRMPTVASLASMASPLLGFTIPAISFSRVDLPVPFGPTTPILAPG